MGGFTEYANYDGLGLAELVRRGELGATELLDAAIARTEAVNGDLNAVVLKHYDEARAAIAAGLPEGLFSGVPFLLKNLELAMRGTVTTHGSAMYRGAVADYDSTLVSRYRAAGLLIFGKTNAPEFGLWPVTEPELHGPSRNPWNTAHSPGGSSGGAGAAVAAGIVPLANASDGGGSIRIPASCNGLVGLKPTRGRTPWGPKFAEAWAGQSIGHVVSRSVRDSAAALDISAGSEPGSPYCAPHFDGSFLEQVSIDPGPLRIAVSFDKWGPGQYQPEAIAGLHSTVKLLESLGHTVEEARPDHNAEALAAAMAVVAQVSTSVLCRARAQELGCTVEALEMEDGTRLMLEMAGAFSADDYANAVRENQLAGFALSRFHQRYDVLLLPTMSRAPVPVGYLNFESIEQFVERLDGYMGETALFNQTGQPSLSLPLCWSDDGLPVGMMFSAAFGNDALLLRLAGQLEKAQPWWDKRPPAL